MTTSPIDNPLTRAPLDIPATAHCPTCGADLGSVSKTFHCTECGYRW